MMECTDRHFRYLLRLISLRPLLYTEMITSGALLHGDPDRYLAFHPIEHPVAAQIGGSDPDELAQSARIAAEYGYDEVNLNVGCPSTRVQKGRIGACLMADPDLVADCVAAMASAVPTPISVKTRIGIDDRDSHEFLAAFVDRVAKAGCAKFVIHARKALLSGLSPKQNRQVPPLRYDRVFQIKADFPDLEIVLNGGITSLEQAAGILDRVDGLMIGREAYKNPYLFAEVDRLFYADSRPQAGRIEVLRKYLDYTQEQFERGAYPNQTLRHLFGLFHARPQSRKWRRVLGELMRSRSCNNDFVIQLMTAPDCS